jgi:hypothetical protein
MDAATEDELTTFHIKQHDLETCIRVLESIGENKTTNIQNLSKVWKRLSHTKSENREFHHKHI